MNSLNWKGASLLIVVVLTLAGCVYGVYIYNAKRQADKFMSTNNVASSTDDTLTVNRIVGVNSKREEKTISFKTSFYDIQAKYPVEPWDKNGAIEKYVNDLVNKKKEEWKDGGAAYNDEMKLRKDFPDKQQMAYQLNISFDKYIGEINDATTTAANASIKGEYITYIISNYEFTGGAHGDTDIKTFMFRNDGEKTLGDIVNLNEKNNIAIAKIIINKLPNILGEGYDQRMAEEGLGLNYLKKDGTFDLQKCVKATGATDTNQCNQILQANLQNYYISNNGITFVMGQYQVAPYAAGMPQIPFTWNELQNYLITGTTTSN